MPTCAVRFINAPGVSGPVDSAVAHSEQDLLSSGSSSATTITADGSTDEVVVIYPLENIRVAFGSSPIATTSAGPIAFANQPNVFRNLASGDKVAVITAT